MSVYNRRQRKEIAQYKQQGNSLVLNLKRYVMAGGTSRIFHWLTQGPFAIVSARRPEKTPEQNALDFKRLKQLASEDGYGFFDAKGFFTKVTEDSIFIPGISLREAVEYGKMPSAPFDARAWRAGRARQPHPQESIIWGEKGMYNFFIVETGRPLMDPPGNVARDFTVLSDVEVKSLRKQLVESEGDDLPGFTEIKRRKVLPFTLEREKMLKLREKEKGEQDPPKQAAYIISSDPARTPPMGNFVKLATKVSMSAGSFDCEVDDGAKKFHLPFGMLLFAIPISKL